MATTWNGGDEGWTHEAHVGLTAGLTDDVQLDAGVGVSLREGFDAANVFAGFAWRR